MAAIHAGIHQICDFSLAPPSRDEAEIAGISQGEDITAIHALTAKLWPLILKALAPYSILARDNNGREFVQ